MFGYVRAYKPEMKFKDFELYKGVYCSLCKEIGKRYGLLARLTLSYDFTFFALVRMAVRENCVKFSKSKCSFNPAKKCFDCGRGNEDLAFTADVSMMAFYYKLIDNINDSNFLKKMLFKVLLPYARRTYNKAVKNRPEAVKIFEIQMKRQSEIESRKCEIDESADPSAKMLSQLLCLEINNDNNDMLAKFGYYIGRWVYIIDAVDDCEDDIKNESYNPLKERYCQGNFKKYSEEILELTMGEAINCFNLLKWNRFYDIIRNILYNGSRCVVLKVLEKEVCQNEKSI